MYPYSPYPQYPAYPVPVSIPQTNFYDPTESSDYTDTSYSSEGKSTSSSSSRHRSDAPVIRIRKHPSKSSLDPRFQEVPSNLRATDEPPYPIIPKVVPIRRRSPEIEAPPIIYPYPVFVAPPPPPPPLIQPMVQRIQPDYRLAQPIQTITKPLSPPKSPKQKKKLRTPPAPSDHYETETFSLPSTREERELRRLRPPVRVDSKASMMDTTRTRSRPIIVDEYEKPKGSPPGLSYRPLVKGKTTREMENENADQNGGPVPNSIIAGQNVTYRDRQRRQ